MAFRNYSEMVVVAYKIIVLCLFEIRYSIRLICKYSILKLKLVYYVKIIVYTKYQNRRTHVFVPAYSTSLVGTEQTCICRNEGRMVAEQRPAQIILSSCVCIHGVGSRRGGQGAACRRRQYSCHSPLLSLPNHGRTQN